MSMPSNPPTRGATPAQSFHSSPQSANPPNLHYPQPLMPVSTTINGFLQQQQENTTPTSAPDLNSEVDPQIVEALKSKDRIFVLKCGEMMENLIREPSKMRAEVAATTSYQRMLVHRCSSFYKTALEVDQTTKVFYISLMPESCIPERKISDLVPPEAAPQPSIKIMQRTSQDRKPRSQANSVAGDDAELSDLEPSESGSLGGKSTSTTGHKKKRPTIEEREAAYKEARSRIFMGFEEKEKGSMNSSCSSLSLTSSSAGAGSDPDDCSSPATESEWSTSNPRENKREFRRGSGASSSRNGRSSFNGTTGVRNPRASSPSFKYASIYDSPQTFPYHDPNVPYPESFNHGYLPSQYPVPYPPPSGHPSNLPFSSPYLYYSSYNPYQPPPQSQPHPIDGMPTNGDMYAGPMAPPANNFGWQNAPPPPPPQMHHPQPPPQVQPNPNQMMNLPPPPGQGPPYMPYHVPPYPYPAPSYYPPPGQMVPSYPNPAPVPSYDMSRPPNGTVGNGYGPMNPGHLANGHGTNLSANSNRNMRNATGPNMNGASKGRSGPTAPPARSGWSYGPGVGGHPPPQPSGGDVVGPRLSSRRSGHASRSSSINDDVSSTSSTSSSSRRTYTSTTSSQHPLPPRPDWAVAMTMAPSNHSHSRNHSTRSLPPTRNGNNASGPPNMPLLSSASGVMPPLQPTDFPPLTSIATPERRPPNMMGAWSNTNMRSALPSQGQQHPSSMNPATSVQLHQFDVSDRCFERPPPKSAELFNHKSGKGPLTNSTAGNGRLQIDNEKEQRKNDTFVEHLSAMTMADQAPPGAISHGTSQEPGLAVSVTLKVGT
ncbi:hypothetical protein JOM56_007548 [Amanita muscaria]